MSDIGNETAESGNDVFSIALQSLVMFQELWSILYIYRALTVAKTSCPHRLYKDPSQAISMRTIGNPEERNALI